ncbi:MAG TPA: hypothetical protein DCM28_08190 [Phycisphaerales bacterium]|nr:hypothetical protein [Phycisphaerales bacterium]HCD34931.1 hypothetical protein [Phycisphaerales bacterium]|tara:strand:- start:62555 stop:65467 length:2913 start_codon:yes stop_codon:yes gene_type:complete
MNTILKTITAITLFTFALFTNTGFAEDASQKQNPFANVKHILIIGNSISHHGPVKKRNWTGKWGMAASAEDKDYVHVLLAELDRRDPDIKHTYTIKRIQNEAAMTGHDHLLKEKADLIIIELGDNYRGKATADEFQKPYEQMLIDLKKHVTDNIICVGPWGLGKHLKISPFIKDAAHNQDAYFVQIAQHGHLQAGREPNCPFSDDGVRWHPGDEGMKQIALTILAAKDTRLVSRTNQIRKNMTLAQLPVDEHIIQDGKFVTIQDKHLTYDGKRLKVWGVNFCHPYGNLRDHQQSDLMLERLKILGVNTIRLNLDAPIWLSGENRTNSYTVPATQKNVDSKLERFDYVFAQAKKQNIFFWFTFDRPGTMNRPYLPDDYDLLGGPNKKAWAQAIAQLSKMGGYKMLPYFDDHAYATHVAYAKAVLNHVNPYTGKRYADDEAIALHEIGNENRLALELIYGGLYARLPQYFQDRITEKFNAWLKHTYHSDAALHKAWGKLQKGESLSMANIAFAPVALDAHEKTEAGATTDYDANIQSDLPRKRLHDVHRFIYARISDHYQRFTADVRALGKGIAQVPINISGGAGENIPMHASLSMGDFYCFGNYGFATRQNEIAKDDPNYPFVSRLNQMPMLERHGDLFTVAGKPNLFYEVGDHRPNPFKTYYPLRIALNCINQDWDGACFFQWDNYTSYGDLKKHADYGNRLLPMAGGYPNAGLVMANDEVKLAAIKSAGALYKSGALDRAEAPLALIYGADALLEGGEQANIDLKHITELRRSSWQQGLRVSYDITRHQTLWPKLDKSTERILQMGSFTTFNWQNHNQSFVKIDAPAAKVYCGFITKPTVVFKNTTVTGINRNFASISIIAEDGLPLDQSKQILITLLGNSQNMGLKFKPDRMTKKWRLGLVQAVVDKGHLPIDIKRLAVHIQGDWLKDRKFEMVNFKHEIFKSGTCDDVLAVSADDPVFFITLGDKDR